MNPIFKSRWTLAAYSAAMLCFALLCAILPAAGSGLPAYGIATDAAVYWVTYGLTGTVIWNILKYALPAGKGVIRGFLLISSGIMAVALITGIELLAMYLTLGSLRDFVPLLPVKIFISLLGFIIFGLYYQNSIEESPNEDVSGGANIRRHAYAANSMEEALSRITVRNGRKIKIIPIEDVEYMQAEGDYVAVVTDEGRWLKEQTMKYFDEHLPPDRFIRIHRSYIVNMSKISRIERYGSQYQVALRRGEKIKVSAQGYKLLKERLNY